MPETPLPQGKKYPDRGERWFVPGKRAFGTVIEIVPVEEAQAPNTIYYLVEFDSGERLGFTADQMVFEHWVGDHALTEQR